MSAAVRIALAIALAGLALAVPAAGATPTQVSLRVDGGTETLFEGPLAGEGHEVEASSDTQARLCNGINPNDPENVLPAETPTAAAADAMKLLGETFDGRWYSSYDDYLITRWGPVREAEAHSWFEIVNHVLTSLGGCQVELHPGAEVVWAYALASPAPKAMLELYPAPDSAAVAPLTATAKLAQPFTVEVQSVAVSTGKPPSEPERKGFTPATSAVLAPVGTDAKGFETIESESPARVVTNAEGQASITFATTGWHRLKAAHSGALDSNRLDVCVSANGAAGECGPPPAEDLTRSVIPPSKEPEPKPEGEHRPEGEQHPGQSGPSSGQTGPTSPGGGTPGGSGLQAGGLGMLRVAGYTLAALDVRAPLLHFHGHWHRFAEASAWHGIAALGRVGASVTVRLAAGRPAFALLGGHRARVEIRAGGRAHTLVVHGTHTPVVLLGSRRAGAGQVQLRVISGEVALDGVAVTS